MAVTVRISIMATFLTFFSCVHMHKLYSSYFTFSHQKQQSEKIAEFKAETELTCALRCSAKNNCDEATFYRNAKKCFLYQNKEKGSTEPADTNKNTRSKIVTMRKVRNAVRQTYIIVVLIQMFFYVVKGQGKGVSKVPI